MLAIEVNINSDGDFATFKNKEQIDERFIISAETKNELKEKFINYIVDIDMVSSRDYLYDTIINIRGNLLNIADMNNIYKDIDFCYGNQSLHIRKITII